MPIYHRQQLEGGAAVPAGGIEPLTGGHPAVQAPAVEVFRSQDRIASLGRRIVLRTGLAGSLEWRVPNTTPHAQASQTHPNRVSWYEVARTRFEQTPGTALEFRASVLPSGATQRMEPGPPVVWVYDGAWGRIRVTCTWHDRSGGSETQTYTFSLPHSTLEFAAESTDPGALFRDLRPIGPFMLRPPDVLTDLAELSRFSKYNGCGSSAAA